MPDALQPRHPLRLKDHQQRDHRLLLGTRDCSAVRTQEEGPAANRTGGQHPLDHQERLGHREVQASASDRYTRPHAHSPLREEPLTHRHLLKKCRNLRTTGQLAQQGAATDAEKSTTDLTSDPETTQPREVPDLCGLRDVGGTIEQVSAEIMESESAALDQLRTHQAGRYRVLPYYNERDATVKIGQEIKRVLPFQRPHPLLVKLRRGQSPSHCALFITRLHNRPLFAHPSPCDETLFRVQVAP